jgi:hypothetical protein
MRTAALALTLGFLTTLSTGAAESVSNQLTEEDKAAGWQLLFDGKTTAGWHSFKKQAFPTNGWDVQDGWLHCRGKGGNEIISAAEFENFELEWDWKQAPGGNSGIKYFVTETRDSALGHEYQMIDDEREPDAKVANGKHVTASLYDVLKPERPPPIKPSREINHSRIVIKGNRVEHWLNGAKVLSYSCGSEAIKEAVARSKFKNVAQFGDKLKGHLLLQDHGSEVWFRNIRLRALDAD